MDLPVLHFIVVIQDHEIFFSFYGHDGYLPCLIWTYFALQLRNLHGEKMSCSDIVFCR